MVCPLYRVLSCSCRTWKVHYAARHNALTFSRGTNVSSFLGSGSSRGRGVCEICQQCGILALLCSAPYESLQERQKDNSPGEDILSSSVLAFETLIGNRCFCILTEATRTKKDSFSCCAQDCSIRQ